MEVKAHLRFARITPRKVRTVGTMCGGLKVQEAHNQLTFSQKRGGRVLLKLLNSAISNAKERGCIDVENLYVKQIVVNEGPMLKRFLPRAMGRATPIQKKMSHITLILDEAR